MKILIIYPNMEVITGGQAYDHYVIDHIKSNKSATVELLTDDKLGNSNKYLYNFYYLNYLKENNDYDVIITNSRLYSRLFLPFLFLRIFYPKIEIISTHHLFNFLSETPLRRPIHKFLEMLFLRLCTKIIIPSQYLLDLMKRFLPRKKILYMGLAFKDELEKKHSKLDQSKVLYVGTIENRKGLRYLLEALDMLQKDKVQFTCDIVGKINDVDYYQKLVSFILKNKLQDRVHFRGHIYNKEVLNNYYQEASCFAFPSLHESFGIVLIEAMSFGVPIATFNNTAMPYTVKHNFNGLLALDKDSSDLKDCIKKILTDIDLRNRLALGALETYLNSKTYDDLGDEINQMVESGFKSSEICLTDI